MLVGLADDTASVDTSGEVDTVSSVGRLRKSVYSESSLLVKAESIVNLIMEAYG